MILSSSDIFRILSSDPVIRVSARVKIVDNRPPIDTGDSTVIYISRYPTISDFQATWNVWIADNSNEPLDVILAQLDRLLPGFQVTDNGIIVKATVTELKSANTEIAPVTPVKQDSGLLSGLQAKFDELKQSIEDRMLLVGPGRPGKDGIPGKDGRDGRDGRDGNDLIATNAELDDLKDVFTADAQRGQFLMFDGASWVARFVPQILRAGGAGGSGTGGGIEEAPLDGNYYVRQNGQWVNLVDALSDLGNIDAGDFTTGIADTNNPTELNGGDFSP